MNLMYHLISVDGRIVQQELPSIIDVYLLYTKKIEKKVQVESKECFVSQHDIYQNMSKCHFKNNSTRLEQFNYIHHFFYLYILIMVSKKHDFFQKMQIRNFFNFYPVKNLPRVSVKISQNFEKKRCQKFVFCMSGNYS